METELNFDFNNKVVELKTQLTTLYQKKVEQADDKTYARQFYRTSILEQNPNIPKNSYFFNLLTRVLMHNYKLQKATAFEKTMNELGPIRQKAEAYLNILLDVYTDEASEPTTYLEEDNLETELYLLSLDYSELTNSLALFLANTLVLEELPDSATFQTLNIEKSSKPKSTHNRKLDATVTFTESQQVLALHLLFEHLGLHPRRDHSLSDFARFAHLLSRTQITTIDNSPKLSMTKRLLNPKNEHPSLKDLLVIKPYFEKIGLDSIVEKIDTEIKFKQEES